MVRPLVTAEYVHGDTGIDGAVFDEPSVTPAERSAVDFIVDTLSGRDGVTLCTLGPLTNIGMALARDPSIAQKVDPEAADLVFRSGIPLVMMPLDVTHKALTSDSRVAAFDDLGSPAGRAVAGMLRFYERYDKERYGIDGAPLHDPTVIAYLLDPEMFEGRDCNVMIETESDLTRGMTVVDWWGLTDRPTNCHVVQQVDADRFFELLVERIGRL